MLSVIGNTSSINNSYFQRDLTNDIREYTIN
jgi:hypothetical protein